MIRQGETVVAYLSTTPKWEKIPELAVRVVPYPARDVNGSG